LTASHPVGTAMVPLARIAVGYNPRRYFDRKKHDELVASLRLRGMLQPMLVRPAADLPEHFTIVAGGRRYRAAMEVFGENGEVPVLIREMTDQEALDAAIAENDDRDDPSETEQADAAVRYLAACQGDRAEAARRLGWSRAKLDRRLALADLSETVKTALDERRIKVGHAELLAAVPADKQDKALETIIAAGLDIAKTRDLLMKVTQRLADALFDKTECTTCPFNSGTQRALFDTHVDDGHCTNTTCFQLKTEAVEAARREAEAAAEAAEAASAIDTDGDEDDNGDVGDEMDEVGETDRPTDGSATVAPLVGRGTVVRKVSANGGPSSTAKSIAGRTSELREATWRTALARGLADDPSNAQAAILVAALTGTLSHIKADTLTSRAALLVDAAFPDRGFKDKIAVIRELSEGQATTVLAAIGAAYARDVQSFAHVADLAGAFGIDIRTVWQVDRAFLERYTKDELKFIAGESGLVAHMGEKAFSKLLGAKKGDLISGMLNAVGFDWAGRVPSAMALDGRYAPPRSLPPAKADEVVTELAA